MKIEKQYTEKEIMSEFEKLSTKQKLNILSKALDLSLQRKAGTKSYAIARSMGYRYEDDGSYTK